LIKLFRFLKPYTATIVIIVILFLFQALIDLSLPTFMAEIVNKGVIKNDIPFIFRTGGLMMAIALAGVICALAAGFLSSRTALSFSRQLRSMIFERAGKFSLNEFDKVGTASLITRTTNDVIQVQQTLIIMLSMMMRAPLMSIGGIIMAVSRDAHLSLVLAVSVPVMGLLIFMVQRSALPLFRQMQKRLDALNLVIREKLTGVREVRAFDRTLYEEKKFDKASNDLTQTAISLAGLMSSTMPVVMTVMNLSMIAIVWFGGLRVKAGLMNVGDIMAFVQYVTLILFSLMMISMLFILIPRSQVSADRINEVLDLKPSINDPLSPVSPEPTGTLEFKNVTFKYHGAEKPALCNVSFSAAAGKFTGIIGGTGSGKSTMANLCLRFYDTDSGSVLVDGVDVREFSQQELRSRIGYTPQKAVLFTGSISENISFGNTGEIETAIAVSQSADFIESLPEKQSSIIAQGGKNFSGGQKQRLSIARAIAKKPEIYIFDDSFSALDFKTDAALRAALKKETAGATVIIIAQRVASVLDADNIIVLDEGGVAGFGTHKELMKNCPVYREIVSSQLSLEELP
jgi:ATP-binding cassette, subfamily B, multidrug efflux pump